MKNIIKLMVLVSIFVLKLSGQDIIDPARLFEKDTLSILDTRPATFIKGWNWGGPGRAFDEALKVNTKISFIPEH